MTLGSNVARPRTSRGHIDSGRDLTLLRSRTNVLPQDVFDVAPDIMRHRLVLSYEALAREVTADHVLARVLSTVPAPRIAPSQDHVVTSPIPSPSPAGAPVAPDLSPYAPE